jgi:hypothetical protein
MSADYRQLASIALEHYCAHREDALKAWRERGKVITKLRQRAAEAESGGLVAKFDDAEHRLLFDPCKGL